MTTEVQNTKEEHDYRFRIFLLLLIRIVLLYHYLSRHNIRDKVKGVIIIIVIIIIICTPYGLIIIIRAFRVRKPQPTPKFKTKVIWDSSPDFRINPDPDLDVRRICPEML